MKVHPFSKREKRKIKGKVHPKLPRVRREDEEFGPGEIDYLICPQCHCVYFNKSWHHSLEQDIKRFREEKQVKFQLCPACQLMKDGRFEGEVIIENVPERFKEEIKALIRNFGKRAFEQDPMDRIISIKEKIVKRPTARRKRGAASRKEFEGLKDIEILTTENQLAVRLAKKIDEIFGGRPKTSIGHSEKEDIVRIRISF